MSERRAAVPFVLQMESVECGAACLTMVLRHHGCWVELSEVREATGVSRDGVSARAIVRTARGYGLTPRAQRLEPEALAAVAAPAILHWEMNHFVVLERWTPAGLDILDPAVGPRTVAHGDVDRSFTGVCIAFERAEGFASRARPPAPWRRYVDALRGSAEALRLLLAASLVLSALGVALPSLTTVIVDDVLGRDQTPWLSAVGLGLLAAAAMNLFTGLVRARVLAALRVELDLAVTARFAAHLFALPMRFFAQRQTPDLVARVLSTRLLRELVAGNAVALLVDAALLVGYLALLAATDARLGAVVALGASAYAALYLRAAPRLERIYRERLVKETRQSQQLYQTVRGVATVKSAGREFVSYNLWLRHFANALNAGAAEAAVQDAVAAAMTLLRGVVPVAVLAWGAQRVVAGALTLGEFLAAQMLQGAVLAPLDRVIASLLQARQVPLHLDRMEDVLQTPEEPADGAPAHRLRGELTFEDVTFRYGPTSPDVLAGLSLTVRAGEKVAVVGASGCGKSTLARVLLGFYAPTSGRVLVDGVDLATLDLASFRRQVGVVLQETALFEGTVRDNIALYHRRAPFEDIVAAARVAQIHDDILALPDGYDTVLRGSGALSGGQRQRLALARAVLHRPAIMVLDEATSALDAVTEAAVERFLASRTCTRVVIAHRLSTVRDADRVVVLDQGRVVQSGRHEALLATAGPYADLVALGAAPVTPAERPADPARVSPSVLASLPTLAALTAEEGEALAPSLRWRDCAAGEAVLQQGERAAGLSLVVAGRFDVVLREPGLAPYRVGELSEGDVFGELSLLDGSPASATLTATTPGRLIHLPLDAFESLRDAQDAVAARLFVRLGALVAARLRASWERRAAVGATLDVSADEPVAAAPASASLRDTALGASMTDAEFAWLAAFGDPLRVAPREALTVAGAACERCLLLLRGRAAVSVDGAVVSVARAGDFLGHEGLFDAPVYGATVVALEAVTAVSLDLRGLRGAVDEGEAGAWKVLRHAARDLGASLRLSNLRLREAVARRDQELDVALRAREDAARSLVARVAPALTADGDGRLPVVAEEERGQSGVACAVAVLRGFGRAVSYASVAEACTAGAQVGLASLMAGVRSFGFLARALSLDAADLRALDGPLILAVRGGRFVVAERWRDGALALMDPAYGHRAWTFAELTAEFEGRAIEVRASEPAGEGIAARAWRVLERRRAAVAPVLAATAVLQAAAMAGPAATTLVVGEAIPAGDTELVAVAALALASVVGAQAVAGTLRRKAIQWLRAHLDAALLDQLLRHTLRLPMEFFERTPPGEVIERFEAMATVRALVSGEALAALVDLPMALVALAWLAVLGGPLALLVGAAVVALAGAYALASPRLAALAEDERAAASTQRTRLIEALSGIASLRASGDREAAMRHWFPAMAQELAASTRQDLLATGLTASLQGLRLAALGAATWWGARRVLDGAMTVAELAAFGAYAAAFLGSAEAALASVAAAARARTALARIARTFAERAEQSGEAVRPPGRLRGRITLEGVTFRYTDEGPAVLQEVSLSVEAGMKVAIVGGSGAGKSTLGKLLLGFYVPRAGRVLVDGRDLRGLDLPAVRAQMGVVLQDAYVFAGSLRENIATSAPNAPLDQVVAAARAAALHDVIDAMPMKYETLVPEGGASLSGGQRQRLAIARALVHQPAVLLLDEATSALDNATQAAVEGSLAALSCTRVVIAHRLSTVIDADLIVVLERGRVVEAGRHAELLARGGAYRRLVEAQLG